MVVGKRGATIIFSIMFAILIFVLILALTPALTQFVDISTIASTNNSVGLDCSNENISIFDDATCNAVQILNPLFIGVVIGLAGLIIGARVVFGGS